MAQFYLHGQDAASTKWNQFSSEHYQYIYPRGLDSLAMNFAHTLEYFYPHHAENLDHLPKKMPVILHNEVSYSNGVFVWAPKRLEIFTNPDPNGFPQDWMKQLALHEGRHSFQIASLNKSWGKALSILMGEQAVGALTGYLPMWYLEGDAVDAETRFSHSGRGRLPSFEMGTKALLIDNEKRYSFSKAALGSYKEYIPNHYELGYLLVRYGKRTYGEEFWKDAENMVAKKPYLLVPMTKSFRAYGVRSKPDLYNDAMDLYQEHWTKSLEERKPVNYPPKSMEQKFYTNYRFPSLTEDHEILAYKSGIDIIPEIVLIDSSGAEKRIHRPGYMNTGRIHYSRGFIVWDEYSPDIRWSNRSFSVIKLLDLESKEITRLGQKSRYYAPALSHDGTRIAAIEQKTDYRFNLIILDLKGNVLQTIPSPGPSLIQHPAWMEGDTALLLVQSGDKGESLYSYSLQNEEWKELFHSAFDDISFPRVEGHEIFFSSTFEGIDDIYSYNIKDSRLKRHTQSAFGAFDPYVAEGRELFFSEYSSKGYRITATKIEADSRNLQEVKRDHSEQIDWESSPEEKKILQAYDNRDKPEYKPENYSKLKNVLKIHSWLPLYFDYMNPEAALTPERLPLSLGATVLSQNLLSTVEGMAGYEYRDKIHMLHSGVRLHGRIPVFDLSLNYGGYPGIATVGELSEPELDPNRMTFSATSYIPLRFSTGKFITYMQPLINYSYTSDLLPNATNTVYEAGIHRFHYRFYFVSYLRKGVRDIMPRLGISAIAGYRNAPFDKDNFGSLTYGGINIYLPGILRHQSLKLGLNRQVQDPENYLFSNNIGLPRGMTLLRGLDFRSLTADYSLPLLYPDLSIEPLLYIKRIRTNLWFDYMQGKDVLILDPKPKLVDQNYHTFGADILFDFHPFRLFFPFSMGTRISYVPESQSLVPELLFSIEVN